MVISDFMVFSPSRKVGSIGDKAAILARLRYALPLLYFMARIRADAMGICGYCRRDSHYRLIAMLRRAFSGAGGLHHRAGKNEESGYFLPSGVVPGVGKTINRFHDSHLARTPPIHQNEGSALFGR
jgi:hypothetical protein